MLFYGKYIRSNFPPQYWFLLLMKNQVSLFSMNRLGFREVSAPQAFNSVREHRWSIAFPSPYRVNLSAISEKGPARGCLILAYAQLTDKENNSDRKVLSGPSCLREKNVIEEKLDLQSLLRPIVKQDRFITGQSTSLCHCPSSSLRLSGQGESTSIVLF